MAKYLITCIQDMEGMRLACLLQKFTAFKSMKQVSKTLTIRMLAARELKDRRSMKKMYSFLIKLDVYRKQALALIHLLKSQAAEHFARSIPFQD
ncbi:hypothetical protein DPEC_G00237770 [Dallia pectoralis]|uniref:Uncharacterized protein n=1 Tax=Dallia pectoralis TaxID=75939 RepID=A0ACC2FYR7_DALPE|nr:hypothetical protein DPEC_G00237770 [Dallia pectoralis]